MKKIAAVILTVLMMMSMSLTVFASIETDHDDYNDYSWEKEDIEGTPSTERWSYIAGTSQGMSITDDATAIMTGSLTGYQGTTTKVIIYMYLQRYQDGIWKNLTWTKDEFNRFYGTAERLKYDCSKGTYRLKVSYYAYAGSKYENHVAYSARYHYQ